MWRLALLCLAFFLSGCAALVYQVSWQRILALHSGVGIYSVAMIVAAFMAGLGWGSWVGGVLSPRLQPRAALRTFGLLELGIALFGAASRWLYYDLYPRSPFLLDSPWRAGLLHFAALLLPTAAMGMSLPFLTRGLIDRPESAARRLGFFYGVNVVGAGLGALATPWWLVRSLGLSGAVMVAAGANAAAGILAVLASLGMGHTASASSPTLGEADRPRHEPARPFALWLALYATSGFCALALEILWFRIVDVAVKSTSFAFGTVLSLYLLSYGTGSLVASAVASRIQRPLRTFLALQCAIVVAAALPLVLLRFGAWPFHAWYVDYWRTGQFGFGWSFDWTAITRLYLLLPLMLYGLPTFLMGFSFPVLQRAVQDDVRTSGRKVGLLQTANVTGCVAGSLLVGLLAIGHLGTIASVRLVIAVAGLLALCGLTLTGARRLFAGSLALLLAAAALLPAQGDLWRHLHGAQPSEGFVGEDASGVAGLIPENGRYRLLVNGRRHSWLPFGGIHTRLGALPAVIHEQPREVAIVGLGSGDTAWGVGTRAETRAITVFEICGPQPRLLRQLSDFAAGSSAEIAAHYGQLRSFLEDPRYSIRIADGRTALRFGDRRYDIIQADAQLPDAAYSGNLYSYEFFELCASRLAPGGLMCTWSPTPRVRRTFRSVYPHVLSLLDGVVLIGSREPIALDPAAWVRRADSPEVQRYLGAGIAKLVARDVATAQSLPTRRRQPDLNHDLIPRDEYAVP